jgi:DivIVA domain-containing protein
MSLDRRSIERQDFPARLRGYDRAAVDAHLRALADELEARAGSLADVAGEQVRAVLAAAEASAAEIVTDAERDAVRTRDVAGRAGDAVTSRAVAAAGDALARLEALRGDLEALLGALRPASEPTVEVARASDPVTAAPKAPEPIAGVPEPPPALPADPDRLVPDPDAPDAPAADEEAEVGARLVALELALSGTAREQADRYLSEHFGLGDRAALLDDVYALAGR